MRLRIGLALLFSLLLSAGCRNHPADAVKAANSISKSSAQTQCVTPLALAEVTAKKDLTWNPRSDGTEVISTVTYGAHSVLALSVEFTGDDLRYRVVSMNHPEAKPDFITAPDGTQCAQVVSGKSLTGYAEIATLCAGETYQVFLQTCNRNGDCSDETPIAKPYLQDRKRDAGVQAALVGVDQSRQAVDAIAEKAYQIMVAYYQSHKDDLNPSPERKQFLDMAQRVENMGLDLYKTVAYSQYGQVQETLQSNLQLVGTAAAPVSQNGCALENQLLQPNPSSASALALAGGGGGDTTSSVKKDERKAGIVLLAIGTIGAVVGRVIWAQARNQLRNLEVEISELKKTSIGLESARVKLDADLESKTFASEGVKNSNFATGINKEQLENFLKNKETGIKENKIEIAKNEIEIKENTKNLQAASAKKTKAEYHKAAGLFIGVSMAAVAILGAVLTGIGGNLADTGTSAEATLITSLSPLTQQLDDAFLQNYSAYLPLQEAIKASTVSK